MLSYFIQTLVTFVVLMFLARHLVFLLIIGIILRGTIISKYGLDHSLSTSFRMSLLQRLIFIKLDDIRPFDARGSFSCPFLSFFYNAMMTDVFRFVTN